MKQEDTWMLELSDDDLKERQAELWREAGLIEGILGHRKCPIWKMQADSIGANILAFVKAEDKPVHSSAITERFNPTIFKRVVDAGRLIRVAPQMYEAFEPPAHLNAFGFRKTQQVAKNEVKQ